MKTRTLQFFKNEHFIEPLCVGELRFVLDRVTQRANEILEHDFLGALDEFYLTVENTNPTDSHQEALLRISSDLRTIALVVAKLNSEIKALNRSCR